MMDCLCLATPFNTRPALVELCKTVEPRLTRHCLLWRCLSLRPFVQNIPGYLVADYAGACPHPRRGVRAFLDRLNLVRRPVPRRLVRYIVYLNPPLLV